MDPVDKKLMRAIDSTINRFGGVLPRPEALKDDPESFAEQLRHSLAAWKEEDFLVVWLEIPIAKSALIPVAVEQGFSFHHSGQGYLMLTHQLEEGAFIPSYSTHYIGAGGVVINEREELLVVSERYHGSENRPPFFKLPGGALQEGEHLTSAAIREVYEETGVETEFERVVCFRHWTGYRYGKSDIYFVCRLRPLSEAIVKQDEEIAQCLWMPLQEYLDAEGVSLFNKEIVRAALTSTGVAPTVMDGHRDPHLHEFFMPADLDW